MTYMSPVPNTPDRPLYADASHRHMYEWTNAIPKAIIIPNEHS
jgi:hypothetical protein